MAYIKGKLRNYPCFCDKSENNKEFTKNRNRWSKVVEKLNFMQRVYRNAFFHF